MGYSPTPRVYLVLFTYILVITVRHLPPTWHTFLLYLLFSENKRETIVYIYQTLSLADYLCVPYVYFVCLVWYVVCITRCTTTVCKIYIFIIIQFFDFWFLFLRLWTRLAHNHISVVKNTPCISLTNIDSEVDPKIKAATNFDSHMHYIFDWAPKSPLSLLFIWNYHWPFLPGTKILKCI